MTWSKFGCIFLKKRHVFVSLKREKSRLDVSRFFCYWKLRLYETRRVLLAAPYFIKYTFGMEVKNDLSLMKRKNSLRFIGVQCTDTVHDKGMAYIPTTFKTYVVSIPNLTRVPNKVRMGHGVFEILNSRARRQRNSVKQCRQITWCRVGFGSMGSYDTF